MWVLGCPGRKKKKKKTTWGPGALWPGPGFWGCGSWGAQEEKNGVLGAWSWILGLWVLGCPGIREKKKEKKTNWDPGALWPGPGLWGCGSWGAQEKKNGVLGSWGLVLDSEVVGPGVPKKKKTGALGPGPGFWSCGSWGAQDKKKMGCLVLDSGVVALGVPRREKKRKTKSLGVQQSALFE